MKLGEVQAFILAQIAADPTLGPVNTAVAFDMFATQESQRKTINDKTRLNGFCIEVSLPQIPQSDTLSGGETFCEALVEVYVAEDRTVAHTPSGLTLVDYVVAAINQRNSRPQHLTRLHGSQIARTEQGLILHQLSFAVRVENRPGNLVIITDAGANSITDSAGNTVTGTT